MFSANGLSIFGTVGLIVSLVPALLVFGLICIHVPLLIQRWYYRRTKHGPRVLGGPRHISEVVKPGQKFTIMGETGGYLLIAIRDVVGVRFVTTDDVVVNGVAPEISILAQPAQLPLGWYCFSAARVKDLQTRITRMEYSIDKINGSGDDSSGDDLHTTRARRRAGASTN